MLPEFIDWIVKFVDGFGYLGIFIMTFIESTFIPIPSEVTMIPAGYLVYTGDMNFYIVLLCSVLGTVGGSLFNYYIAYHYGRKLFLRYGKYFFLNEDKLAYIEKFFLNHGAISVFSGRLVPGLRHYISFPAGLAHMNLQLFSIYTALGGAIWMAVLLGLGYFIGHNKDMMAQYLPLITWGSVAIVLLIVLVYSVRYRRKNKP